ncbi:serine hydrolase domain-containing protein [Phenylobacterium sp.]|jgi:CubicO group peptidase (beta-lactamase class C family)|uniref:serine hydrolase domain-containing protein n=1 Tax=Phenylobacterium sp. TaxID=1871053 RepID=UPI002E33894B|nr:serine hydrolase domain-containing protein [Phenylobacterium sp.]HEX3364084.1 serine hydrolase domain-containing protein [Phenylobacterium sp.]
MQASQAAPNLERVQVIIDTPEGEAAPGCALAIFRGGESQRLFSGFADIEAGRRPDSDTLYYAGSLAKQFTALAVVQLVLAGQIDLEAPARRYLPELAARSPDITVEMLLHHTSGLPNYAKLAPLAGYQRPSDLVRADVVQMLLDYEGGAFPPGATFEYSNGGYLLLSAIVERLTGTEFAIYVRDHILDPIGMSRSLVLDGAFPEDVNLARGYMPAEGGFALAEQVPMFGGAGAMMFTLDDLERYFHDIEHGHRVWTPEVTQMMTAPGLYADGSPVILPVPGHIFGYAGGLMLSRDWVQHGGNFAGFQAWFGWRPGTGVGLALLCNRGDVDPLALAARIVAAVAPDFPAPDAQRFVLPGFAGRFVSDSVTAVYEIATRAGEDLDVTITPPGRAPPARLRFQRTGEGVFAAGALILNFDPDHRGFSVRNENVSVRYRRVP